MYVTIEVLLAFCALLVDLIALVVLIFQNRGPLNILRAMSGAKNF